MNEVHDVQPGHIYQPGNKKEVRLVYRILSGPYCGRHQKPFSLTKWGVAGAWDAAQQAKAYMLQTGRLPPSFASPYSRSKLTNASANAIVKPVRPAGIPGVDGFLGPMDLDGTGSSALFPSLAAFSATTKPPEAALGKAPHARIHAHSSHFEDDKSFTTQSSTTSDALDEIFRCFSVDDSAAGPATSRRVARSQKVGSRGGPCAPNFLPRCRKHSVGTSSSTASAPLSPVAAGSDSVPRSFPPLDNLSLDSAVAAELLLSPLLDSLCKAEARLAEGESEDVSLASHDRDTADTSGDEDLLPRGVRGAGSARVRKQAAAPSSASSTRYTGKDLGSPDTAKRASFAGSKTLRRLLLPDSLRVSASPGLSAFSEGAGAHFPSFLPSPQTGYQRAAPGWAYPSSVQATLEASARAAAVASAAGAAAGGGSGPSCFHGQQAARPAGPGHVASCGGAVPADLIGLQMLSGGSPHFAPSTLQRGSGTGGWVESPSVPVGGSGAADGNVAAATAFTLLQLAEHNAAVQPKDQSQLEQNTLQQFLLLQQLQLLQEKQQESQQERIRGNGGAASLENQGTVGDEVSGGRALAGDVADGRSLCKASVEPHLKFTDRPVSAESKEMDDVQCIGSRRCAPQQECENAARLNSAQSIGSLLSSTSLAPGQKGGGPQERGKAEDAESTNMSDTLRSLLIAASIQQRHQALPDGNCGSQQNRREGSVSPLCGSERAESFFNLRSLTSLLPQAHGGLKAEERPISDGRGPAVLAPSPRSPGGSVPPRSPLDGGLMCSPKGAEGADAGHGVPSHLAMLWGLSSLESSRNNGSCSGLTSTTSAVSVEGDARHSSISNEGTSSSLGSLPDCVAAALRDALQADFDTEEDGAGDQSARAKGEAPARPSATKLMSPLDTAHQVSQFHAAKSEAACLPIECNGTAPCDLGNPSHDVRGSDDLASSTEASTRNLGCSSPGSPLSQRVSGQMRTHGVIVQESARRGVPSNPAGMPELQGRATEPEFSVSQGEGAGETCGAVMGTAPQGLNGRRCEARGEFQMYSGTEFLDHQDVEDRESRKRRSRSDGVGDMWDGDKKRGRMFCGIAASTAPTSSGHAVSAERGSVRVHSDVGDCREWSSASVHSAFAGDGNVGSRLVANSFAPE
ncbi:AP2 domain transcription factor AP2VIII-5 [Besnoitia besnoiti]|uniref:AP2 domain transcription factor AP2VIII-5 n=1 Tax=Besnoitia besnoiti TaxID=94643 RepID=A0A2A9MN55_BESBE|nr:AP2 domain transcription factor AP2VIII-5 [Besnoitia besnoiti]PFH37283.1 AP2 domain transcription factor AP2VIII-5 [Besnoitia besnoiti]